MNATSAQPEPPSCKGHVLLVEDDQTFGETLGQVLRRAGYDVSIATDFRVALEVLESSRPIDLLLTDIVMPHTSGPQLVAEYLATRPAPVVVYMSGYADEALAQYELDPATVFLRKPFTPAILARTIRDALAAARGANVGSAAD
jgi:two-component system, cell cycle sensor histidine kinase and response regulator CckA